MCISGWSSDVCSSNLVAVVPGHLDAARLAAIQNIAQDVRRRPGVVRPDRIESVDKHQCGGGPEPDILAQAQESLAADALLHHDREVHRIAERPVIGPQRLVQRLGEAGRSEEHTSELQSLMRISYAVFCLKKNTSS